MKENSWIDIALAQAYARKESSALNRTTKKGKKGKGKKKKQIKEDQEQKVVKVQDFIDQMQETILDEKNLIDAELNELE